MHVGDNSKGLPSILIVEDHVDTLRAIKLFLQMEGFEAVPAATCAEALAAADRRRFDLVVCDVGLSDGDGCELFRQLRAMYGLEGIAHSAYAMPRDLELIRAAGFAAHVVKPAAPSVLLAAIRGVLARRGCDVPPENTRASQVLDETRRCP